MAIAVDTNVLLDLLAGESAPAARAEAALLEHQSKSALIISEIVYAELAAALALADALLTRDRGFYATRFKDLRIIHP